MTMTPDELDWRPYHLGGVNSRVLAHATSGHVEYELCGEGGRWLIRRTTRLNGSTTVEETSRGCPKDVAPVWAAIWRSTLPKRKREIVLRVESGWIS
jgi:hypothetical protein